MSNQYDVAIVTGPLAPYRVDLYEEMSSICKSRGGRGVKLFYGQNVQLEHQWSDLVSDDKDCDVECVPGAYLPAFLRKFMTKLRIGNGRMVIGNRAMYRKLKEARPHVVAVCEVSPYTLPAIIYAKCYGAKLWVFTEVGNETASTNANIVVKVINALGVNFADGVAACAPGACEPCFGRSKQLVLAPHAVKTKDYAPFRAPLATRQREKTVILYVGNCIHRKGIDLLFEALAQVENDQYVLRILGGGELEWTKDIAKRLNLLDKIEFAGFKDGAALREEYQQADMFVLPSRSDTYGVVTHEAAICGLPLLISKYAGSSETLVENGKNGYVIDPEDAKGFAAKLNELVMDKEKRIAFGECSVTLAEKWSIENTARKLINAFCKHLKEEK